MADYYEVTIIGVRPGMHPRALEIIGKTDDPARLACWYCDIGAVNQVMIVRKAADATADLERRFAAINSSDPLGLGDLTTFMTTDTYVSLDFMPPLQPGRFGPCFEVRNYVLNPGTLAPTTELWRKAVPGRMKLSPLLAAMTAVTGAATRFLHIWPYKSFDERARLRDKAIAEGVWPPPGGPGFLLSQQVDIYLPAAFSPLQ